MCRDVIGPLSFECRDLDLHRPGFSVEARYEPEALVMAKAAVRSEALTTYYDRHRFFVGEADCDRKHGPGVR
jgi:hypothetical protein